MPAPKGNLNAIRNTTRLPIRRLVVGEFPAALNSVKIEGRKYRRALEDAVLDVHGEVTIMAAHWIDSASAATVHCGVCRWLLRQKIDTMTTADILSCSREMVRAKQSRDRCLVLLKLDANGRDVLDALYGPAEPHEPDDAGPTSDVSDGKGKAE